jgi:hypothetical protein
MHHNTRVLAFYTYYTTTTIFSHRRDVDIFAVTQPPQHDANDLIKYAT